MATNGGATGSPGEWEVRLRPDLLAVESWAEAKVAPVSSQEAEIRQCCERMSRRSARLIETQPELRVK